MSNVNGAYLCFARRCGCTCILKKMLLDSNMDINANDMLTPDAVLGAVGGATPLVAPPIDKLCDGPTTKQGNSAGSIDQSA